LKQQIPDLAENIEAANSCSSRDFVATKSCSVWHFEARD
jgi:hypothetical protein